jgi:cell division protein FtsB
MAAARIRWDRIGRWALIGVFALVLYLYIGPARTWVSTWLEAKQRRADVATLREENHRLRAREAALKRTGALEREARRLGMVKAGEKEYVVRGLPR